MKRFPLKLTVFATAFLALGALLGAAERKGSPSDSSSRRDDDATRKYDKNGNGRLDPDEEAAKKADEERAKRAKKN